MGVVFRDHFLSDLIGFVYSRMDAARPRRISAPHSRQLRRHSLQRRDAMVPIILDGKTRGYYHLNGRRFSESSTAAFRKTSRCAPSPWARPCA